MYPWIRRFSVAAFLLVASALVVMSAERPPNVVVILADDLGWADLSCYGSRFHKTPNLDRMAAEGLRFTDAYAACTVCSPTRAALMTGKAPARLHLTDFIPGRNVLPDQKLRRPDFNLQLPLEESTLAEKLKAKGYRTACFGKWHLGGQGFQPTLQGFDEATPDVAGVSRRAPFLQAGRAVPELAGGPSEEELTAAITRNAVRFLRENRDEPFFLYLPHVAVHIPLYGKPDRVAEFKKAIRSGEAQTNAVYAAMLESLDAGVGAVLDELRALKLDRNTVVLFTSDNGGLSVREGPNTPATSNAPLRAGKGYQYEGGLRVPLIAWAPGLVPAGGVSHDPVITMDLHATLLELAGAEAAGLDGVSLVSLMKGSGPLAPRSLYWHYPHYSNQGGKPAGAIREGNWKLVEHFESGYLELFDLSQDPGEAHSVSFERADVANGMAKRLAEWRKSVGAQMPTVNSNYVSVPIQADATGTLVLPAHEASTHGQNVRYEPPANKNTLGYWTRVDDWVSWDVTLPREGLYSVEVLQGCGKGSGGSEVEISVGGASVRFTVEDTGHFQKFVRRNLGTIRASAGRSTLAVHPKTKPGVAVMDLREVVLRPVAAAQEKAP